MLHRIKVEKKIKKDYSYHIPNDHASNNNFYQIHEKTVRLSQALETAKGSL